MNVNQSEIDSIIIKGREEHWSVPTILETLASKKFKTKNGNDHSRGYVYSRIAQLKKAGALEKKDVRFENKTFLPTIRRRKKSFIEIPAAPESNGKMVAVIGTREDVEKILQGWMR